MATRKEKIVRATLAVSALAGGGYIVNDQYNKHLERSQLNAPTVNGEAGDDKKPVEVEKLDIAPTPKDMDNQSAEFTQKAAALKAQAAAVRQEGVDAAKVNVGIANQELAARQKIVDDATIKTVVAEQTPEQKFEAKQAAKYATGNRWAQLAENTAVARQILANNRVVSDAKTPDNTAELAQKEKQLTESAGATEALNASYMRTSQKMNDAEAAKAAATVQVERENRAKAYADENAQNALYQQEQQQREAQDAVNSQVAEPTVDDKVAPEVAPEAPIEAPQDLDRKVEESDVAPDAGVPAEKAIDDAAVRPVPKMLYETYANQATEGLVTWGDYKAAQVVLDNYDPAKVADPTADDQVDRADFDGEFRQVGLSVVNACLVSGKKSMAADAWNLVKGTVPAGETMNVTQKYKSLILRRDKERLVEVDIVEHYDAATAQ